MEPTRKARAKHRAPTLRMLITSQSKLAQARIASNIASRWSDIFYPLSEQKTQNACGNLRNTVLIRTALHVPRE